jgi:hypothetical protein
LDFERVGTVNLWKSGPLFSTGTDEMEPAQSELRLNLRWPEAGFRDGFGGEVAGGDER